VRSAVKRAENVYGGLRGGCKEFTTVNFGVQSLKMKCVKTYRNQSGISVKLHQTENGVPQKRHSAARQKKKTSDHTGVSRKEAVTSSATTSDLIAGTKLN